MSLKIFHQLPSSQYLFTTSTVVDYDGECGSPFQSWLCCIIVYLMKLFGDIFLTTLDWQSVMASTIYFAHYHFLKLITFFLFSLPWNGSPLWTWWTTSYVPSWPSCQSTVQPANLWYVDSTNPTWMEERHRAWIICFYRVKSCWLPPSCWSPCRSNWLQDWP